LGPSRTGGGGLQREELAMSNFKKPASSQILGIYMSTKARLQAEEAKSERDLPTLNNILAFSHILHELEEQYEICGSGQRAA
jgi:hypothetical protein